MGNPNLWSTKHVTKVKNMLLLTAFRRKERRRTPQSSCVYAVGRGSSKAHVEGVAVGLVPFRSSQPLGLRSCAGVAGRVGSRRRGVWWPERHEKKEREIGRLLENGGEGVMHG